jgi:hypothetical protein
LARLSLEVLLFVLVKQLNKEKPLLTLCADGGKTSCCKIHLSKQWCIPF